MLGLSLLLVTLAVGLGVASLGGPGALREHLARMRPGWLGGALALMMLGLLLAGPRFLALLPAGPWRRPGPLAAGTLLLGSTVLNLSFPGPVGEVAIAAAVQRRYGVPASTALAASLQGRLAGLASSGLLLLALLPLVQVPPEVLPMLWTVGGLLGLAGLAAGAIALRPDLLAAVARAGPAALSRRLPGRAGQLLGRLAQGIDRLAHDLAGGLRLGPGPWLRALGWSALSHGSFALAVLCCAAAVGESVSPLAALVAHTASVVASAALVILPGGLGAWDASFGGVLSMAAGLPLTHAALVLVAVRVVQTIGLAGSALAFLAWSRLLLSGPVTG